MLFTYDLDDEYSLALRTLDTVDAMHDLTVKNLDRLRPWEPWAAEEQTLAGTRAFTAHQLEQFVQGRVLPLVILKRREQAVGSASLKIDSYLGVGELGYWIDGDEQGMGVVTRACAALIEHASGIGLRRVEIRTAVANTRSANVARRLGFAHEGTLRGSLPVGEARLDVDVFGRVLPVQG